MLIEKRRKNIFNVKNFNFVLHNPVILKTLIQGKSKDEIRAVVRRIKEKQTERLYLEESHKFIASLKNTSPFNIGTNYQPKLNRLCYIEDWNNQEFYNIVKELHNPIYHNYNNRKNWISTKNKIPSNRRHDFIHRKDWEWTLGIIAMKKFNKLNNRCTAIGIGTGREDILFYLANNLKHVYATDLYDGKEWNNYAIADFPENPRKYAPFPYKEDTLTVLRMDGTNLEFPSETFDIAFSFSSIEHFGGERHEGALKSMREIERVLKPTGIAVIATEYILNNKEHIEFFNKRTIYTDLINKLERLKLVEPLDLRITTKTLDTVMNFPDVFYWDTTNDNEFRKNHPQIIIRVNDILVTPVMLVFKKQ